MAWLTTTELVGQLLWGEGRRHGLLGFVLGTRARVSMIRWVEITQRGRVNLKTSTVHPSFSNTDSDIDRHSLQAWIAPENEVTEVPSHVSRFLCGQDQKGQATLHGFCMRTDITDHPCWLST